VQTPPYHSTNQTNPPTNTPTLQHPTNRPPPPTHHQAVTHFSPGSYASRPYQATGIPNFFIAGDWVKGVDHGANGLSQVGGCCSTFGVVGWGVLLALVLSTDTLSHLHHLTLHHPPYLSPPSSHSQPNLQSTPKPQLQPHAQPQPPTQTQTPPPTSTGARLRNRPHRRQPGGLKAGPGAPRCHPGGGRR